ncbi:MAG: DNA repair protein RadA [Patescibacteria group bacterium]
MVKQVTKYICQSCEAESPRWVGQCPGCGEWNTLVETVVSKKPSGSGLNSSVKPSKPVKLSQVVSEAPKRISSNIDEFDRVLGGGFVPGQAILISGDPGIGKSTLLTQLAKEFYNNSVLYVCGEESMEQIKLRAARLNYSADNLFMLPETDADIIASTILAEKDISLVIVDSIQTLSSSEYMGVPGSVGQVRGCTQKITNAAKKSSIPTILVGHVTKEGAVAGPKVLEHLVDTVLYLEGDNQHMYRILKTTKNRFGPISEVGVFEMTQQGMEEVKNPSKMFLSQRLSTTSGSCLTVLMEGQRPIIFEIQALTARSSFGYPKRTANGFNVNRLQLLIAILEKRAGINLSNHDVYINVAGGFKVEEYAGDLAVCLAIASAIKDKPIKATIAAFGECGLSGEIRQIPHEEKRIKEAKKLGYGDIISPKSVKTLKKALDQIL